MANQDQIDMMMRNFPPEAELLQMSAEDVGMHLIKYMTRGRAETNRFNFLQIVPGGQVAFRFMEGTRIVGSHQLVSACANLRPISLRYRNRSFCKRAPG
jgi:hypothetical protein